MKLIFPCCWGLVLLIAFYGWGCMAAFALRLRLPDFGALAAVGVASLIAIGGVMNLTVTISPQSLYALVCIGLAAAVLPLRKRLASTAAAWRSIGWAELLWVPAGLLLGIRFLAGAAYPLMNILDDQQAYYLFPLKMLQTGELGADPFSARRVLTALGGMYFLQGFAVAPVGLSAIDLIDTAIGSTIAVLTIRDLVRHFGGPQWLSPSLSLFFLLTYGARSNATADALPVGLYLAAVRILGTTDLRLSARISATAAVGLLASALCVLKSNQIPTASMFVAFALAGVWRDFGLRPALQATAAAAGIGSLVALPWMIAMYESSGTLLYPICGKGFHGPPYTSFPTPDTGWTLIKATANLARLGPLLLSGVVIAFGARHFPPRERATMTSAAFFLAAVGVGGMLFLFSIGGGGGRRYTYSFLIAALLVFIAATPTLFRQLTGRDHRAPVLLAMALYAASAFVFFAVPVLRGDAVKLYATLWSKIVVGSKGTPLIPATEAASVEAAQASVPPGSPIISRLSYGAALRFDRNPVYIVDWPGCAWAPPGLQEMTDAEALAEYFRRLSLRYLAYSYRDGCFVVSHLDTPGLVKWDWDVLRYAQQFQDLVEKLSLSRERIYEDEHVYVLDLERRTDATPAGGFQTPAQKP